MDCEIAVCLKASALVTVTHRTMYRVLTELSRFSRQLGIPPR